MHKRNRLVQRLHKQVRSASTTNRQRVMQLLHVAQHPPLLTMQSAYRPDPGHVIVPVCMARRIAAHLAESTLTPRSLLLRRHDPLPPRCQMVWTIATRA